MLHTGDIFETRARSARHQELRHLTSTLLSLLFRHRALKATRNPTSAEIANDCGLMTGHHTTNRAA